jgi:dihydrolipoamide dehydrogenase
MTTYDVVVIGSGPGGYVSAIRAAQLGMHVALVERYASLGGTCLNVGCIPSKALLESSERFFEAGHRFADHGIRVAGLELDWPRMQQRKTEVVASVTRGVDLLMKANKVDVLHGTGRLTGPGRVEVTAAGDAVTALEATHVVVATGSKPSTLPGVALDGERVISSTQALSLPHVPGRLAVIGGGVIGLEIASVYARLGTSVTVLEFLDSLLPTMDRDCSRELHRVLRRDLKIDARVSHRVTGVEVRADGVTVRARDRADAEVAVEADLCLVAVGRYPYTEGLGLEAVGITLDAKGFVPVDEDLRTPAPGVWAIGDVVGGLMLAHKAEEEGIAVAERIAGQKPHLDPRLVPSVVYTWPEVAAVGRTEEELVRDDVPYKVGKSFYRASGRARAGGEVDGIVKVIAHKDTDEILGVHLTGPRAADLVAEAVVAMAFRAAAEDVARTCHAHPTYAEALREAALAATGNRAIHG